jgi:hypothetical protein
MDEVDSNEQRNQDLAQIQRNAQIFKDTARAIKYDTILVAKLIGAIEAQMALSKLLPKLSWADQGVSATFNADFEHCIDAPNILNDERAALVDVIRERYAADPAGHPDLERVVDILARTIDPGTSRRWNGEGRRETALRELKNESPPQLAPMGWGARLKQALFQ